MPKQLFTLFLTLSFSPTLLSRSLFLCGKFNLKIITPEEFYNKCPAIVLIFFCYDLIVIVVNNKGSYMYVGMCTVVWWVTLFVFVCCVKVNGLIEGLVSWHVQVWFLWVFIEEKIPTSTTNTKTLCWINYYNQDHTSIFFILVFFFFNYY